MPNPLNRELLQRAMELTEGDKIILRFDNPLEMDSVRASLFRERTSLSQLDPSFSELAISRFVKGEVYALLVYRRKKFNEITILSADGEERTEELLLDSDLTRICKLMEEDGKTPEEIAEFKESYLREESCSEKENIP